jgi:nucleotide-binding universal stress UspA family protein
VSGTIVVGFVDSPEGHAATKAAAEEALLRQAKLVLVSSARGGGHEDSDELRAMTAAVEQARDEIAGRGVDIDVQEFVRGNDPAEDVLTVAEERDATLIVIGVRRRSPVGKLLLGSNSQSILLQAECPVLAVKAPRPV